MTTTTVKKAAPKKSPPKKVNTIVTYIREARSLIGPILKEADANMGRGGSYSYTSTEAMLGHCRDIMTDLGLVLTPEKVRIVEGPLIGEQRYPVIETVWRLDCDETGEHRMYDRDFPMENLRTPLKGACSVMTTHWLYILRDILMIPRLDSAQMQADSDPDGEKTARDNEARNARDAAKGLDQAQIAELTALMKSHPKASLEASDMCRAKYNCDFSGLSRVAATGVIAWIKNKGATDG